MFYLCENYYKPIKYKYFLADSVSWVPRPTLLDLQTNWIYKCTLGMELFGMQGIYYSKENPNLESDLRRWEYEMPKNPLR